MQRSQIRVVGSCLAIIALFAIHPGSTFAGQVSFSPVSKTVAPYDTFEINIVVDAGVPAMGCFNVQVAFLRPNVRVLDVRKGTVDSFFKAKDTLGIWDIFGCRWSPPYPKGPTVLATIKFATDASPCNTPLQFTYVYFQDTLGDPFSVGSTDGMIVVPTCCNCPLQGDINGDMGIDVFDVIRVIGIAFSGEPDPQDPGCPKPRGDVNNDGGTDVFDVIYIIGTAFSGGASPIDPCNPGG